MKTKLLQRAVNIEFIFWSVLICAYLAHMAYINFSEALISPKHLFNGVAFFGLVIAAIGGNMTKTNEIGGYKVVNFGCQFTSIGFLGDIFGQEYAIVAMGIILIAKLLRGRLNDLVQGASYIMILWAISHYVSV